MLFLKRNPQHYIWTPAGITYITFSVFFGIAPVIVFRCSVDLICLVIGCPLVSIDSHRFIYFRCPWKYICCGLTVEVSSLACPWKYIRRPARGIIPLAAFYLQVAFKPLAGCEPLAALYIRLHVTPWLHLKLRLHFISLNIRLRSILQAALPPPPPAAFNAQAAFYIAGSS